MAAFFPAVSSAVAQDGSFQYTASVSAQLSVSGKPNAFYPEQKITYFLEMRHPPAGQIDMVTVWVKPDGQVERKDLYTIENSVGKEEITYYAWMELVGKDIFASMLSSGDYDASSFGEWTVYTYVNNRKLGEVKFFIVE